DSSVTGATLRPSDEGQALRRTLRELTAASALSAVWSRAEPPAIAESLAEVLFRALAVEFVYVRVTDPAHEAARTGQRPAVHAAHEIGKALEPVLKPAGPDQAAIANPVGKGTVRLAIVPLGWEGDCGVLAAGSQQPSFPSLFDSLLLRSTANQAAVVLHHKQVEQSVRESEERFRLLVEGVADYAIFMLDAQGHVVSWNAGAERIKGYSAEEIVGRHLSCFYTEQAVLEGRPARELEMARVNGRFDDEGWRVRKDGSRFWANVVITALHDGQGTLRGFSNLTRDLTERRRTTETLRSVVEHVVDGIVTIDEGGEVQSFNPAAERLFGYAADEVVGRNVKMLMPEPYQGEHDGYLAAYVRTGEAKIIGKGREVIGRRKDGSTFPMELAVSAFELDQSRFFTGIVRDITERKNYERELERRVVERTRELTAVNEELR